MQPQLLKVSKGPNRSFSVRHDHIPQANNCWHYHAEVELIHFKRGEGTQFVGDNIKNFKAGDVVLVGANLPHYWRFDDVYFESLKESADVRVSHFNEDFWGEAFLGLPENAPIKGILEKARRGLQITGKTRQRVAEIMEQLLTAEGPQRVTLLIEALSVISVCKQLTTLSSIGFKPHYMNPDNDRINAIYEYSIQNFKRKIHLEEIAEIANVSPNSFCRFFKSRTRKTYSQFLIELRVGHACKLLIESDECIKRLCYESGFHNFASFHKSFKTIMGKSPLVYRKEYTVKR